MLLVHGSNFEQQGTYLIDLIYNGGSVSWGVRVFVLDEKLLCHLEYLFAFHAEWQVIRGLAPLNHSHLLSHGFGGSGILEEHHLSQILSRLNQVIIWAVSSSGARGCGSSHGWSRNPGSCSERSEVPVPWLAFPPSAILETPHLLSPGSSIFKAIYGESPFPVL